MLQECQESGAVERRRQGPEHGLRCLRVIDAEVVVAGAKQEIGNDNRGCEAPAGRDKGHVYAGGEGLGEDLGREAGVPDGVVDGRDVADEDEVRSEEHTSELQSLMRISYAVFCLKKKTNAV